MIARATVYLTEDRKEAVAAGDARARYKLVHIGQEISEEQAAKYEGAAELIAGKKKAPPELDRGTIETRDPRPAHRDPLPLSERIKKRQNKGG